MVAHPDFQPHRLVKNPHIQTLLSRYIPEATTLRQAEQEMILDIEPAIRLQGFYSPNSQGRGLVLLLHGWLGCATSNYVLAIGEYLYQQGYAIFRLNMRDHGDTHHLNPAPFRSDLLDEIFQASQQIAQLVADKPFYIMGASLGGNFALRLAWLHAQIPIPNLAHTVAINPVINPYQSTLAMDHGLLFYLLYFRYRWRRSLLKKQASFPTRYDFSEIVAAKNCLDMTACFVRQYTPYPDVATYFASYTITQAMMYALQTPVTIITAADDPIIAVTEFDFLIDASPYLKINIQPYGGHVSFMDILPMRSWLGPAVQAIIEIS